MTEKTRSKLRGAARSRLMWLALLLQIFGAINAALPGVQAAMSPELYGWLAMFVGVVIAALRWGTERPLEDR